MAEMSLREVCEKIGVTRRAVQGYEKAKLVKPSSKTASGYLLYDDFARQRIQQIKLYQDMGFTIKEIKHMIDAPSKTKKIALTKQKEKLKDNINHQIKMIEIIEEMLLSL